jgi:PAS domain S-box-containing protein
MILLLINQIVKQTYIITLVYICFSSLYIIFSDHIVSLTHQENTVADIARIQTVKGISFVLASGLLIFAITSFSFKRLERALKNSNEYQVLSEQIIANSNDATGLFDENGLLIMSNKSLRSLMEGQKIRKGNSFNIGQQSNRVIKSFIEEFLIQKTDQSERVFEFSTGTWLKISMTKIKIIDEQQAVLLRSQNITEHVLIEQTLRENEMKYMSIFHKQPFGVLLIDGMGKVKFHNDLFMTIMGLKHSRELRTFWGNAFPEEEKRAFELKWEKAELKNTSFHMNLRVADAEGQHQWREVYVVPINEHSNRGFIITVRDITNQVLIEEKIKRYSEELKLEVDMQTAELQQKTMKMEEYQKALTYLLEDVNEIRKELEVANNLLKMSNKELEAFSYSVSHDLQAPLRSIHGFSQALVEEYGQVLDEQGRDYLNRISNSVGRMGELINDLLLLSKVSRAEMHRQEVNVTNLAYDIISEFKDSMEQARYVDFSIQNDIICQGDGNLLRILFSNLIQNAVKFSTHNEKPKVVIGKDDNGNMYIQDNGVGFDMKHAEAIFEPFQRLHSSIVYEGSGIGLTIVRRIIHRHRGEISVTSKPNEGTTFYFNV